MLKKLTGKKPGRCKENLRERIALAPPPCFWRCLPICEEQPISRFIPQHVEEFPDF